MPLNKIKTVLSEELAELEERGSLKGAETVVTGVKESEGNKGPRYLLEGYADKEFLRMNSIISFCSEVVLKFFNLLK